MSAASCGRRRSAGAVVVVAAEGLGLRAQALGLLCVAALLMLVADRHRRPRALWLALPLVTAWG
jgi:hypothetical protein